MYNLFCEACKRHTTQEVVKWQSKPGHFDSLSVRCLTCDRLLIVPLSAGVELTYELLFEPEE